MTAASLELAQVRAGGAVVPVVLHDGEPRDLRPLGLRDLLALIESGERGLDSVREAVAAGSLPPVTPDTPGVWVAPILRPPRNVFCVGANYVGHVAEGQHGAAGMGSVPTIFTKPATCLRGAGEPVDIHSAATGMADWEGEIAFVIGRAGKDIAPAAALRHVFGFTLANDVSARDMQRNGGFSRPQWFKGKSLDGFLPLGPRLVVGDPAELIARIGFEVLLNGETVQKAELGQLYFDIPAIISYLSRGMMLLPGDVVLTGTPEGVGVFRSPPRFLRGGDVVTVRSTERSSELGELTTPFVDLAAE